MKKLLMMLCFAGVLSTLYAQEDKMDKYKRLTRLFAAWDIAKVSGKVPADSPLPGFQGGVEFPLVNFSKNIILGAGIVYSMQGGKSSSYEYIPGGNYGNSAATTRLNYLNFPVFAHYEKNRYGFFAEAGLQPGLLLSAKRKGSNAADIKANLKKIDVAVIAGVGYKFKNNIGVGLRIAPGITNINKSKDQTSNRNMVAGLSISYSL
jgi:opacity protein-like surface antigen